MKVYLINLDRAPDRLNFMTQAFARAGVAFTRVPAVDGRDLSEVEIRKFVTGEGSWGWLMPGEVGCFLSHRRCWEAIVDSGEPYGAI